MERGRSPRLSDRGRGHQWARRNSERCSLFALLAAASVWTALPARAADVTIKAPSQPFNWAGWYFGGDYGYARGYSRWNATEAGATTPTLNGSVDLTNPLTRAAANYFFLRCGVLANFLENKCLVRMSSGFSKTEITSFSVGPNRTIAPSPSGLIHQTWSKLIMIVPTTVLHFANDAIYLFSCLRYCPLPVFNGLNAQLPTPPAIHPTEQTSDSLVGLHSSAIPLAATLFLPSLRVTSGSIRENRQRPNRFSAHGQCRARHPISSPFSRRAGQGHGLRQDFTSGAKQVLTCRLLPVTSLPHHASHTAQSTR